MRPRVILLILLGIPCWIAFPGAVPAQEKEEKQVRQVMDEAMKSFQKKDLDGFMKVADVPWFHDGVAVLAARDVLKETVKKMFQERTVDVTKATFTIKKVLPFKEGRKSFT